jgi:hypothetical protein
MVKTELDYVIKENSTGKKALILFLITNAVYVFMLMVTIPKTIALANGMEILDMLPTGYDLAYIETLFSSLGQEGRDFYLFRQLPVDFIYPGLFAISYCLIMAYFLKKINKFDSRLFYLTYIPLFAGLADYFENINIIFLLKSYPNITDFNAMITCSFSILKSITTSLSFISLIVIIIAFGISKISPRK